MLHATFFPQNSPWFCVILDNPPQGEESLFLFLFPWRWMYSSCGWSGPVWELKKGSRLQWCWFRAQPSINVFAKDEWGVCSWSWCPGWVVFKIQPAGSFTNLRDVMIRSAEEYAEVMRRDSLKWETDNAGLLRYLMGIWQYIESFCHLWF